MCRTLGSGGEQLVQERWWRSGRSVSGRISLSQEIDESPVELNVTIEELRYAFDDTVAINPSKRVR